MSKGIYSLKYFQNYTIYR